VLSNSKTVKSERFIYWIPFSDWSYFEYELENTNSAEYYCNQNVLIQPT